MKKESGVIYLSNRNVAEGEIKNGSMINVDVPKRENIYYGIGTGDTQHSKLIIGIRWKEISVPR